MVEARRVCQDYEVYGTKGRLWRTGDGSVPNVFIQDADGGDWKIGIDDWMYKPVRCKEGERGEWWSVAAGPVPEGGAIAEGYRILAHTIFEAGAHPLSGRNAIRGFEVVMAVYESARLNERIVLPLEQDRFPLEIMIEEKRR
jgi:UDP-N-acetyl-2-amino-2-deoxyglucuronate dehydrogenase